MEKTAYIEIIIKGKKGNFEITPDSYDIKDIRAILENVEDLFFSGDKRDRPLITYQLSEGSVKHTFKTTVQTVIAFGALLTQINQLSSIDFLDNPTAKVFEQFQNSAVVHNISYLISTSTNQEAKLVINKETKFYRSESIWVDAEFYFYGKVTNMGGKDKANIHLFTEDTGTIIIQTPKTEIEKIENNPLYKAYGIRAIGKQNTATGEIDKSSLKFLDIVYYQPKYDLDYLNLLREKAMNKWLNAIDPDKWLQTIRS